MCLVAALLEYLVSSNIAIIDECVAFCMGQALMSLVYMQQCIYIFMQRVDSYLYMD